MLLSNGSFFNGAGGGGGGGDPYFANVSLLCAFDGSDGATTATDDSTHAKTLTFVGNAQIDTAQSKFGGASLLLDGTGDRVTTPAAVADEFDFGAGQFTIECFVRFAVLDANSRALIARSGGIANTAGWVFTATAAGEVTFAYSSDGGTSFNNTLTSSGAALTTGVWYHLAVDRSASNVVRLYKDGVMVGSSTLSATINNEGTTLAIGASNDSGATDTSGWFDEVRITKGVARYASDGGFTVPTAAYPRS